MASALESIVRRDRLIVATALALIAALAWIVTARLALDMRWMMLGDASWDAGYFVAMFLMWVVMMIAMMVPSAAPAILLFAALERGARLRNRFVTPAHHLRRVIRAVGGVGMSV